MPPSCVNLGRSPSSKLNGRNHLRLAITVIVFLVTCCSIHSGGRVKPANGFPSTFPRGHIVISANLGKAQVGMPYQARTSALGGEKPYQFTGLGLPPGLRINASSGDVFGTPLKSGTYRFFIFVTDFRNFGLKQIELAVSDAPLIPKVVIFPRVVSLLPSGRQQFAAAVTGTSDAAVTWSTSTGAISNSGLFTAPAGRSRKTVLITATSVVDRNAKSQAIVTVTHPPMRQLPAARPPVARRPVAKPPVAKPPVATSPVAPSPVAVLSVATPPVAPPSAQTKGYELSLYGPHTLYLGYDSYVQLNVSYSGKIGNVYFNDLSVPEGITASVICSSMPCWQSAGDSRMFQWNANDKLTSVLVHFQAAADVGPGDYNVAITTEVAGVVQSIDVPLKVLPVSVLTPRHPTFPPPIPGLLHWQDQMLRLASKWCDPKKVYSFGYEADVWYYDGARVFYQIADYTHDNSWSACALNIAKQYAAYVISNKGQIPGWRVFPHGLRMAYERTGAAEYKQAAILLARNSAYADKGGNINDSRIRETAYVLEAYIQAEKLGQGRNPNLIKSADFLMGMFEVIFVQGPGAYSLHQAFFDGLAAAALIEYYQLTGDPRVPPMIKKMLDWVWNNAWNQTSHCLVWGPFDDAIPSCNTELINLVDPAFAWYYNLTGDPTYLTAGDEMFSHALDSDISYDGKIFSQNYRWSFDYVTWRTIP